MALVVKDRVKETSTTTGTGTLTLAGAAVGFQSFSVIGDGNTTYYTITNGIDWEVGIGTYTASGTTLSRDTILESSNGGAAVNWGAGNKDVFVTYPAERSVYGNGSNIVPASGETLPIAYGGTGQTTANNALNALLPFQGSSAGSFLATNGGSTYWSPAPGGLVMYVEDSTAAVYPTVTGSGSIAAGDGGYAEAQFSIAFSGYAGDGAAFFSTAIGKNSFNNVAYTGASGAMALAGAYASGVDSVAIATGGLYGAQSAGSYAFGYNAYAQHTYSFAIGNSAITSAANQIALGGPSDSVKVSDAYTLPTSDGTSSQVLQTDGAGNVSWQTVGGGSSTLTIQNKTGAYTVVAGDLGTIINCTSGTFTVSLDAAATLGAGFNCWIWNTGTGNITIDPSGSETIDISTTLTLRPGEGTQIVCDGTNWQTGDKKTMRGYTENFNSSHSRPQATGNGSTAIGPYAIAGGTFAICLGYGNASGAGGFAVGYGNGSGATASGLRSIALGDRTAATSTNAVAIGANSSNTGSQAVTGSGAMALGGSYASGTDSFAAAVANNTSSYGATGANSVAIGQTTISSGARSFASGASNTASGINAIAMGNSSIASGSNSYAIGIFASATATDTYANGNRALAAVNGKYARASGRFAVDGDAQSGNFVLRVGTTDATASILRTDAFAASNINQVILPNNSAYAFTGLVVARQQASGGTASAAWKIEGLIRREGSAATTVLVNSSLTTIDNTPGWTLALSADTTNGGLAVTATGAAATNIRWVATVQTSEVTYA